ncbi:TPA: hypothetical protein N0F65_006176 [Lagenidium giganteum]|uniref:Rubisco LSMT substrate-binding domain-containing protein n=1 Tax=Lagenidium giganteum TaxID=4803 RepID=A0AAV2Z7J0_9STRA|nr:TPA: hypothetical protein N0F65_006176 [Lagenidium giganteum]
MIICQETIGQRVSTSLGKLFFEMEDKQEEMLTAFLVIEQLQGSSSFWAPYLRALPAMTRQNRDALTSPLFYGSDLDIVQLQDERMMLAAEGERAHAKQAFKNFQARFKAYLPAQSKDLAARYQWARFLVNSRAFSIKGHRFLIPFADFFNGKPHPQARDQDNGQHFLQYHRLQARGITIRADRHTPATHQLFEDYGDNDNYLYFVYHGFLMDENRFDCASFRLPPIPADNTDLQAQKLRIIGHFGVRNAPRSCITDRATIARHEMSLLNFYTTLYHLNATATAACIEPSEYQRCFVQPQAPEATKLELLMDGIRTELKNFPTTIEQDQQILASTKTASRLRHAVAFRLSRKRILLAALGILEYKAQRMSAAVEEAGDAAATADILNDVTRKSLNEGAAAADSPVDQFDEVVQDGVPYDDNEVVDDEVVFMEDVELEMTDAAAGTKEDESNPEPIVAEVVLETDEVEVASSTDTIEQLELSETSNVGEQPMGKKEHQQQAVDPRVDIFSKWVENELNLPINHLAVRYIDDRFGYGAVATKRLAPGEVYLSVPTSVVMNAQSALRSPWLKRFLPRLGMSPDSASLDRTLVLLLHLIEEKFAPHKQADGGQVSFWKPYLDMLPDVETGTASPLFYDRSHLRLLEATDMYELAIAYRDQTLQSYNELTSRLPPWVTRDRFVWATAMLDSRSIWWSGQRHLVPLLDMVNCLEVGPKHGVHHTMLEGDNAVTKASWTFEPGEQVVENYGQPNYIYLLYHGFVLAEGKNQNDCAHVRFRMDASVFEGKPEKAKQEFMQRMEAMNFYSWTPDVCVRPDDNQSLHKFLRIALIESKPLSDPNDFPVEDQRRIARAAVQTRIRGLQKAVARFERLPSVDARHEVIQSYVVQQSELMQRVLERL